MLIISDTEAIRHILLGTDVPTRDRHPRYACYIGAGISVEAGVMTATQICEDIRRQLRKSAGLLVPEKIDDWDRAELNWEEDSLRYMSCIKKAFINRAERVEYFRKILKGKSPSFCHHAIALLSADKYLKNTCVTTNFDKLLESAFTQQMNSECQPIRNDEEARYWMTTEDRHYVIKLHGDYDTHNVLNTLDETVIISDVLQDVVSTALEFAGLVVLGTAGYEKSIHTMFDNLSRKAESGKVLRFGLLWGVYVGASKPKNITMAEIEALVQQKIKEGVVSRDVKEMLERTHRLNGLFCFFPVWGAGNFMFDLVKATGNKALNGEAEIYLDRKMRLRHMFASAGYSEKAIKKHLDSLEGKRSLSKDVDNRTPPEIVYSAQTAQGLEVRVIYGDITSRSLMSSEELRLRRRAVISPEDTLISVGGGVAESLLAKAGPQQLLNELAKFHTPVAQGTIVVTSAGKLPIHYIFHAAAIEIQEDTTCGEVSYEVSKSSVHATMLAALEQAAALGVDALWVPLMGTGVAPLLHEQSFDAILAAISEWAQASTQAILIMIVIYREKELPRHVVEQCLQKTLAAHFTISNGS
jgi:O-acetyl-ADP-ribose deacetylase (regulator of RNase III)